MYVLPKSDKYAIPAFFEERYAYYRAVAYLKAQAYAQAEQAFAQISQEHEQYNEARWQRALLLLRLGRLEEAKRILSDLNRLDGYAKQEKVTEILKQLPANF